MAAGNRGFAAMKKRDPEAQRRIASEGGKAAHRKGTAHEFNSEEARIAGSKGGRAGRGKNKSRSESVSDQESGFTEAGEDMMSLGSDRE